MINSTAWTLKT